MAYGIPQQPGQRPAPQPTPRKTSAEEWGEWDTSRIMQKADPLGEAMGLWGSRRKAPRDHLWRDQTGGYDAILRQFEKGDASTADAIQDLLTNFKGTREELADFMEVMGPMLGTLEARRLEQSPGLQHLSDQKNWDLGAMGSYGAAAGQMGQGTRMAMTQARQGMAAAGLGRGTGQAAIQSMLQQQNSASQAGLRSQLQQQSARNRMNSANTLFDAHRTIAQLALGQQITPRITSPQDANTGIGGVGQGAAAGAGMGASIGGPWGALIGAGVGAGYGAYQDKHS